MAGEETPSGCARSFVCTCARTRSFVCTCARTCSFVCTCARKCSVVCASLWIILVIDRKMSTVTQFCFSVNLLSLHMWSRIRRG
jgi:hypothetical protein